MLRGYAALPHCFTIQSCYGHFVYGQQKDTKNVEPLPENPDESEMVGYRIAYMAFCLQNNDLGKRLFQDLREITEIDRDYIQLGSAEWWKRQHVNLYALQVEPDRYKTIDIPPDVSMKEALHMENLRNQMFEELKRILREHQQLASK